MASLPGIATLSHRRDWPGTILIVLSKTALTTKTSVPDRHKEDPARDARQGL